MTNGSLSAASGSVSCPPTEGRHAPRSSSPWLGRLLHPPRRCPGRRPGERRRSRAREALADALARPAHRLGCRARAPRHARALARRRDHRDHAGTHGRRCNRDRFLGDAGLHWLRCRGRRHGLRDAQGHTQRREPDGDRVQLRLPRGGNRGPRRLAGQRHGRRRRRTVDLDRPERRRFAQRSGSGLLARPGMSTCRAGEA